MCDVCVAEIRLCPWWDILKLLLPHVLVISSFWALNIERLVLHTSNQTLFLLRHGDHRGLELSHAQGKGKSFRTSESGWAVKCAMVAISVSAVPVIERIDVWQVQSQPAAEQVEPQLPGHVLLSSSFPLPWSSHTYGHSFTTSEEIFSFEAFDVHSASTLYSLASGDF